MKKVKSSDKSIDRGDNASYSEKCQSHISCSFSYKLACIDDKFSKQVFFTEEKNVAYKFIEIFAKKW